MSVITAFSKVTTIITGIVLARLLEPSDFGIYGLATSILAFVLIFDEMGLKSAVIQKKTDKPNEVLFTGFFIKLSLSIIFFFIILVWIAPAGAKFYETPDVEKIIILLAVIMLIDNLKFIPTTQIIKSNNLGKLLLPSILKSITYSIIVILLAFQGFSYWSFVYAQICSTILETFAFFFIIPWRFRLHLNKDIGIDLIGFGKFLVIASLLGMVHKQIDNLIVGKILGLSALGYYAMAYRWGNMFITDIGKIVNQALYPLNVKYQDNIPMLERIQTQSMKYTSLIVFPISFGFLITCPEFVNLVLGEKWAPAIIPLQIMSVNGIFWALVKRGNLFEALGKPSYILLLSLLNISLLLVLIFPLTIKIGIIGTAIALTITTFLVNFVVYWLFIAKKYRFEIINIWKGILPSFLSALLMLIIIKASKNYLYYLEFSQISVLVFSVITGILIYFTVIYFLMKKEFDRSIAIIMMPGVSYKKKISNILASI